MLPLATPEQLRRRDEATRVHRTLVALSGAGLHDVDHTAIGSSGPPSALLAKAPQRSSPRFHGSLSAAHDDEPDVDIDITPLSHDVFPDQLESGRGTLADDVPERPVPAIVDDLSPVPVPEVAPSSREIDRQHHEATGAQAQSDVPEKCPSLRGGNVLDDADGQWLRRTRSIRAIRPGCNSRIGDPPRLLRSRRIPTRSSPPPEATSGGCPRDQPCRPHTHGRREMGQEASRRHRRPPAGSLRAGAR